MKPDTDPAPESLRSRVIKDLLVALGIAALVTITGASNLGTVVASAALAGLWVTRGEPRPRRPRRRDHDGFTQVTVVALLAIAVVIISFVVILTTGPTSAPSGLSGAPRPATLEAAVTSTWNHEFAPPDATSAQCPFDARSWASGYRFVCRLEDASSHVVGRTVVVVRPSTAAGFRYDLLRVR